MKKRNILITVMVVIIIIFILLFYNNQKNENEDFNTNIAQTYDVTPEELFLKKEEYKGKNINVLDAYIPSEAYIYIKTNEGNKKIFLEPPNKEYCRYYNVKGRLEEDIEADKWIIYVEDYGECLKEGF